MSLSEKIIAEARAERARLGIEIRHDRNGNRCLSYPTPQPRYRRVDTPDRTIIIHTEGTA